MKSEIQFFLPPMLTEEQVSKLWDLGVIMDDWDSMAILPVELNGELASKHFGWEYILQAAYKIEEFHINLDGKEMVAVVAYHA